MSAASRGHVDIASLLLKRNAKVNSMSKNILVTFDNRSEAQQLRDCSNCSLSMVPSANLLHMKNGKDCPFCDNVPMPVRQKILDIVRRVKHALIVAATNSSKPASAQAVARLLPPGWEARKTNDCKPYYVNHNDKFENMDTADVTFIGRLG